MTGKELLDLANNVSVSDEELFVAMINYITDGEYKKVSPEEQIRELEAVRDGLLRARPLFIEELRACIVY